VAEGDAELLLADIGITDGIPTHESKEYQQLLAAVHDVAEHILDLPDYTVPADQEKYPREQLRRPSEGVPQFFGTDAIPAWTSESDATVVRRALDAGADIVGTTICENFCNSTSSFTSAQGVVHNPYAEGYSAGGSTSGGSAVVGAGLVDIAIGADQGGSIRVPASFCGCMCLSSRLGSSTNWT
jgi:amidase